MKGEAWIKDVSGEIDNKIPYEIEDGIMTVRLYWHRYKGSGKCWAARVGEDDKYEFLEHEFKGAKGTGNGWYAGDRIFHLTPGIYVLHQQHTKTYDVRFKIEFDGDGYRIIEKKVM